jgi:hypothetical protein
VTPAEDRGEGRYGDVGKKRNDDCCEKYLRKSKACKDCPVMASLSKKQRRKLLKLSGKLRKVVDAA